MRCIRVRRRAVELIAVGVIGLVASGRAQAQDDDALEAMSLEELLAVQITSASLLPEDPWTAPAAVYVFSEETITTRGYATLLDLLEDVPGIQVQRRAQVDTVNAVYIRGIGFALGNEKFVILLDGFRITPATGDWYVMAEQFSLAGARQVEVVLGPASALYGPDVFGGVVNIVTHRGGEPTGRVSVAYGQYGTARATLHAGTTLGQLPRVGADLGGDDVTFAITAHLYHSDEPYFPDYYDDEFAWYREQYLTSGRVRVSPFAPPDQVVAVPIAPYATPSDASFVHLRGSVGSFELGYVRLGESHSSSTGVRPEFSLYVEDAILETSLELLYGKHTYAGPRDRFTLTSALSLQTNEFGPRSRFINSFSGYQDAFKFGNSSVATLDEQLTVELTDGLPLVAGLSVARLDAQADSADLPTPYDPGLAGAEQGFFYPGSDVMTPDGRSLRIAQDFYALAYDNVAGYLQLQLKRLSFVELTAGARYDVNSRYGDSLNPRVSVVFKPAPAWRLKLLYGEAFLAAAPFKAYSQVGGFAPVTTPGGVITGLRSDFFFLPNPDLAPEKLRQGEAIAMWSAASALRFSVGGYLTRIEDLIRPGPPETDVIFKGVPIDVVQRFVNQGDGLLYGGSAHVEAGAALGPVDLRVDASYAFTDGELADEPLTQVARHTAHAAATVAMHLGGGTLSVAPRVHVRGRARTSSLDDTGATVEARAPGYATVDVFTRYVRSIGGGLRAAGFVRIDNVLDGRHYHATDSFADSFALAPQDPIRAVAGVSVEWIAP